MKCSYCDEDSTNSISVPVGKPLFGPLMNTNKDPYKQEILKFCDNHWKALAEFIAKGRKR